MAARAQGQAFLSLCRLGFNSCTPLALWALFIALMQGLASALAAANICLVVWAARASPKQRCDSERLWAIKGKTLQRSA